MKTLPAETPSPPLTESDAERAARKQAAVRERIRGSGRDSVHVFARLPDVALTREAWALGEAWRQSDEP